MFTENVSKIGAAPFSSDLRPAQSELDFSGNELLALRVRKIFLAWRNAEPALLRILGSFDRREVESGFFRALSDDDRERALAVEELTNGLKRVLSHRAPEHEEGWKRANQRPSLAIPALIAALRDEDTSPRKKEPPPWAKGVTQREPTRRVSDAQIALVLDLGEKGKLTAVQIGKRAKISDGYVRKILRAGGRPSSVGKPGQAPSS